MNTIYHDISREVEIVNQLISIGVRKCAGNGWNKADEMQETALVNELIAVRNRLANYRRELRNHK